MRPGQNGIPYTRFFEGPIASFCDRAPEACGKTQRAGNAVRCHVRNKLAFGSLEKTQGWRIQAVVLPDTNACPFLVYARVALCQS